VRSLLPFSFFLECYVLQGELAATDHVSTTEIMEDTAIARAVHVLAVVLWIGGLGFVTTVLLPAIRLLKPPEERVACFDVFERRFS
jgi:putative copper export protein